MATFNDLADAKSVLTKAAELYAERFRGDKQPHSPRYKAAADALEDRAPHDADDTMAQALIDAQP